MKLFTEKRFGQTLVMILIVSMTIRIITSIFFGNIVSDLPGSFDQISYHALAQRVVEGYGFSFGETWWPQTPANEPTAHWSFLYTLYLVLVYSIFGITPLAARIIQAIIVGILHPLLVYLLGKRVFGDVVGLLAAGLSAIYLYFVYYSGTLMTEPFYIVAILASIYLTILLVDQLNSCNINKMYNRIFFTTISLGASLGVIVLLRQLFLLFIPFLVLWIWWAGHDLGGKIVVIYLLIAIIIIIMLITPFSIYNFLRFDRFVLLNTNAGFAFYWSNHPIYGTTYYSILPASMGTYQDLIPVGLTQLNEAELDQELLRLGIRNVISDPIRYLRLSINRIPHYFMFWPSKDSGLLSNLSRVASFGILWPFMLFGWVLAIYKQIANYRKTAQVSEIVQFSQSPLFLLSTFVILYSLIHILSWSLIRYRLPVDAILIIFAANGIYGIIQFWLRMSRQRQKHQ